MRVYWGVIHGYSTVKIKYFMGIEFLWCYGVLLGVQNLQNWGGGFYDEKMRKCLNGFLLFFVDMWWDGVFQNLWMRIAGWTYGDDG